MKQIPITRGMVALVDDDDYEKLSALVWQATGQRNNWYASRSVVVNGEARRFFMHRMIVGLEPGNQMEVDHIDGDGLNNQKSNLRVCLPKQNALNKKRSKGTNPYRWVYPSRGSKWLARTSDNRQKGYLGVFSTAVEAAVAANKFHQTNEFARLNEIDTDEYLSVLHENKERLLRELSENNEEAERVLSMSYPWLTKKDRVA